VGLTTAFNVWPGWNGQVAIVSSRSLTALILIHLPVVMHHRFNICFVACFPSHKGQSFRPVMEYHSVGRPESRPCSDQELRYGGSIVTIVRRTAVHTVVVAQVVGEKFRLGIVVSGSFVVP
jgi:hypothetical protein